METKWILCGVMLVVIVVAFSFGVDEEYAKVNATGNVTVNCSQLREFNHLNISNLSKLINDYNDKYCLGDINESGNLRKSFFG